MLSNLFRIIALGLILLFSPTFNAQALPANRYNVNNYLLDIAPSSPSFAYSMRKLKFSYTGFAIKIRRDSDNAEANVSFDIKNIVSSQSRVTVTNIGSGSLTLGQQLDYATFIGSATIYVTTWYDQGPNLYHAIQTVSARQPVVKLNVEGIGNTLPTITFVGTSRQYLAINLPIENLLSSGIVGTVLLVAKPTENTVQYSFGYMDASDFLVRWNCHLNWSDGYCYFDADRNCCVPNRSFNNSSSINVNKQYSFIRGLNYKTVRLNSAITDMNNAPDSVVALSGGSFSIGAWSEFVGTGYSGTFSEMILFPADISVPNILPLENNQKAFWEL